MTHFDTPKMRLLVKTPEEIIKKIKKQKIWTFKPETRLQVLHFSCQKPSSTMYATQTKMSTKSPG